MQLLQDHGYLTVFFGLLLEYLGLPIPGELILIFYGTSVYTGKLDLWIVLITGLTAALLGDHFWFFAGQRGGKRWLRWYCRATFGSGQCMSRTEHFFQHYGPASLLFAKFLPGFRTFAMPMAGMSGVPYPKFLLFDVLGSSLWVAAATGAGIIMATQLGAAVERIRHLGGMLSFLFAMAVLTVLIYRLAKRWKYGEPMAPPEERVQPE
jgi:membrane protein DedA with SNARE-associated domain